MINKSLDIENDNYDDQKEITNEIKTDNDRKNSIGEKAFNFWDYFLYIITFDKKHNNLEIHEKISKKIISAI